MQKTYRARCTWRDMKTGESGVWTEEASSYGSLFEDLDAVSGINDFMWADGNYSCDCNRGQMWCGLEDLECVDPTCIDRFKLDKLEALTQEGEFYSLVWERKDVQA